MVSKKDIEELLEAGIISKNVSNDIQAYYQHKKGESSNRLFPIFGTLGALLVGLGIILILAHNWDELSKSIKTIFAFTPLLIGQAICGYVLLKKRQEMGWREGATTFLFLSIGASISLISQIYNIPGSLNSFLITWMLLCLPLIYLMRSSMASLLYLIGITMYAMETSYFSYQEPGAYWYWVMLAGVVPHYYGLIKKNPASNFTFLHHWAFPLSILISLGTVSHDAGDFLFVGYFSLLGIYILIGKTRLLQKAPSWANAYLIMGILGSLILLFTFSFEAVWDGLMRPSLSSKEMLLSREVWISVALTLTGFFMLLKQWSGLVFKERNPIEAVFLLFAVIFMVGIASPQGAMVIINLVILLIGLWIVVEGTRKDHLGRLNLGLLIISILILCRFFDTDLSFVLRGIIFVGLGISFFVTNYLMLQKRKKHA